MLPGSGGQRITLPYGVTPGLHRRIGTEDVTDYFARMGVPFGRGAYVRHLPDLSKLVIAGSIQTLIKSEEVLAEIDIVPKLVSVNARLIEVVDETAILADHSGRPVVSERKALESGAMKEVAHLELITISGSSGSTQSRSLSQAVSKKQGPIMISSSLRHATLQP